MFFVLTSSIYVTNYFVSVLNSIDKVIGYLRRFSNSITSDNRKKKCYELGRFS